MRGVDYDGFFHVGSIDAVAGNSADRCLYGAFGMDVCVYVDVVAGRVWCDGYGWGFFGKIGCR